MEKQENKIKHLEMIESIIERMAKKQLPVKSLGDDISYSCRRAGSKRSR